MRALRMTMVAVGLVLCTGSLASLATDTDGQVVTGCTKQDAQSAKNATETLIDVETVACVVAHQELADVPAVQTACNIADAVLPMVEKVLGDLSVARAKMAAAQHCAPAPQ